ncbi:peptide ABC transporter substrate-binding protein [Bradyrhizobium symbiodeficiens]|uniref:peptide ABC transporter substrate-binding protein n=1 Tax=Bradyrhizobium symbiodeficiens TaxID=1404367 RepID=UPI000BA1ACB7|nr:peptide ABC transporter substrate-binding protein [Bradyrhizobium symbiodeficiens]AWM09264.1 peptide ABC transporter substrate-binding protein [Bradyrhizobium symbiodeficiens]
MADDTGKFGVGALHLGIPNRRQFFQLGAGAAAGWTLSGSSFAQTERPTNPPDKPRGQVIAALSQEPTVFHPLMPGIEVDQGIWWQVFSPLWYIEPDGKFVPDLAREVPTIENGGLSADGLTWKIKLRSDVKWHDGTPFTAEDVKFSLELINKPDFRARSRVGHSLVKDIKIVAPDEIHWRMETAYSPYMSILAALTFIVPKHILEKVTDPNASPFHNAPVGTGPFRWGERVPGDHIQLNAHAGYHGKGPYVERVVFKYIPDLTVLYTQFRTGQVDYTGLQGILPNFVQEAKTLKGRKIFVSSTSSVEHIAPNLEFGPFADRTVREALYLGINKQAIIDALNYGLPRLTESFVPQQAWSFQQGLPQHKYDPAKANALLDAAGWVRGAGGVREKGGVKLEFTNSTTSGNAVREQTQQLLIQDWRAIGAAMRVNNMPAAVIWGDFWQQSKFNSVLVSVNFMLGSDPDVTPRFGSGAIPAKGGRGYNTYQYRNPEADRLLAEGARQFEQAQRKTTYGDLQKLIRDDLAILPLFQGFIAEGVKEGLQGFRPNINMSINCWNIREWYWA